jgi:RHS repeat-associated protein
LHGPVVDQILADEQIDSLLAPGDVLWPLTDNLGTIRDLATYNAATNETTVINHIQYGTFGNITSETNAAIDHFFGFTGREKDEETGMYYYRARYYDAGAGRFLSEDPIGFDGQTTNLTEYVHNSATNFTDPYGLSPWKGIAEILGRKWTAETCERAGKTLATELLEKLGRYKPTDQKAQDIIKRLKGMGWAETPMQKGQHAGQGMILWDMENGQKTGRLLEWHPGGGHHGPDPYWKFSSGESGTLRYLGGTVTAIAFAVIPGVANASEGNYSDAGRDAFVEFSPFAWSKMMWESLGSFFDSCERQVFGDAFHRQQEEYRREFWEKEKDKWR